jgi:hypothetical protein
MESGGGPYHSLLPGDCNSQIISINFSYYQPALRNSTCGSGSLAALAQKFQKELIVSL